jgi:hypothetical protein
MTTASLKEKPVRDLARLAKQHGVAGWHAMRKDQLIKALVRKARARTAVPAASRGIPPVGDPRRDATAASPRPAATGERDAAAAARLQEARDRMTRAKNLATPPEGGRQPRPVRDRMVLMVRGPHWLHAFWEINARSIARAQAALGQEWHGARPVLRLLELESGLHASPSERVVREIAIHGGVKNWFIDVREPRRYRCDIGYLAGSGRFHALVRSNAVNTPATSQVDTLDVHWGAIADDCERIYALSGGFSPEHSSTELQELFEERLRRPMGPPAARAATMEEDSEEDRLPGVELDVDAELIVYGVTQPGAYVTLQGEPVKVQTDGTFRVRVDLPNRRQVLPIVASTADGVTQQVVVMAVERNTKSMGPMGRDMGE